MHYGYLKGHSINLKRFQNFRYFIQMLNDLIIFRTEDFLMKICGVFYLSIAKPKKLKQISLAK